ncbi:type IV secretory system conjugative DNA transfer family protein [Hyphomicrobium sp. DY-1]|uniref:type IV secretory system conjugative DNA transfer family protein n=1 Tax=Hyphomicrobium sp. DY-1 TaxID=3075650 RepID=UPI0039C48B8E
MAKRKTGPQHGLMLGWAEKEKRDGFPKPVWHDDREGHLITVAPTGAGKGVSCIIPALLTWQGPAIVIDPKGENYAVTATRRRAMGQKVHVLDPFGVTDCIQRASLNPFDTLGPVKKATADDMRVLAESVVQERALSRNNDPYWDNRAITLITEAIGHCCLGLTQPNLRDIRIVVESYDEWCCVDRHGDAPRVCHAGIRFGFNPRGMATDRTRTCITSTAIDHLAFLTDGAVSDSLFNSTIDLKKVERGDPMTVYLVVPPDKLLTHGKLLRLWLLTLMSALSKRRTAPRVPTLLLVDEAAQLGELKPLTTAITLMRGYGVKVWTFWQDLSQLKATYANDWESILNNSSFHQYFGAATPMAARLLQDYLADTCPRPVTALKPNELALYRPGQRGTVVRTPNYLNDAMFAGLFENNPFHAAQPELALVDEDFEIEEREGATVLTFPKREEA